MCDMMDWICEQEKLFFTSPSFTTIVDNILNGTIVLKGSLNSLGRQLGIEPTTPYPYQPFNMNEMLRTTIVQKLFGYVQAEALFRVFHTLEERPTEHEALALFKKQYPTITTPTVAFTETSIHGYYDKNARCATIPGESRVLPFWACDTHHSKLTTNGNRIFFTLPLPSVWGKVTITVRIPNDERFTRFDKVSRPTVYVDCRGRVTFVFAFITDIPKKPTTTIMGVDLGKVEPFVATILNPTEHTYSSPYHADKHVRRLDTKINRLFDLTETLAVKKGLCEENRRTKKAHVLEQERERVRGKISRLKKEKARRIAHQLTVLADEHNATIVVEDLAWLKHVGGKWEHSQQQEAITSAATRHGLCVQKVNAAKTSQTCSRCGGVVYATGRSVRCATCDRVMNRDANASRNIGLKKVKGVKNLRSFKHTNSIGTRLSNVATPRPQGNVSTGHKNTTILHSLTQLTSVGR